MDRNENRVVFRPQDPPGVVCAGFSSITLQEK